MAIAESKTVTYRGTSINVFPWKHPSGREYWRFAWYDQNGKRRFTTKAEQSDAVKAARDKAKEINNGVLDLGSLSDDEARLCRAFLDLSPDWTLIERLRREKELTSLKVEEAYDRFMESKKANAGASTRNVSTLKNRLGHLKSAFDDRDLSSLTVSELDQWLESGTWSALTKKRIRASVVTFFRWARKQELLPDQTTAAEKMAVPIVQRKLPSTYTPAELKKMLKAVRPRYRAWLAISAWAGVRLEEMCLGDRSKKDVLRWEDIDLESGFILIRPEVSKTNERRVIPICKALHDALTPIHTGEGKVVEGTNPAQGHDASPAETKRLGELIGGWKTNALRHSFVSYRCALIGVGKAAMEAGNSEHETRRSYLNAKTPVEAEQWFKVLNIC